jgi:hypothetical protein
MNILRAVPQVEKFDTGLRYTDILFGFVLRELFLRLQNWAQIDDVTKLQLIAGTTLVLGSWIGFRRSVHRSNYQPKFFNLPLFRFLADQLMLILYFRIAVLTSAPGVTTGAQVPQTNGARLAQQTTTLVFCVFALYLAWDLLGLWMARARRKVEGGTVQPVYPLIEDSSKTDQPQPLNWVGFWITFGALAFMFILRASAECIAPLRLFVYIIVILLAYRWVKELRTNSQLSRNR